MSPEDRKVAAEKIKGFLMDAFRDGPTRMPSDDLMVGMLEDIEHDLQVNEWTMEQVIASEKTANVAELIINFPKTTAALRKLLLAMRGN